MMRPILGALVTSGVLAFTFLGCNAILDNQPGTLVEGGDGGTSPDPGAPTPPDEEPPVSDPDAGTTTPDTGRPPSTCPAGTQLCFGTCVSTADPVFGCGDPSCKPCPSAHATMGCRAGKCAVTTCDPGYADCNATAGDGCEKDLSKATSCGTCNAVCGAASPFCTPSGPTFQCTNGCAPAAPLNCGAECVDPLTSTNHCGGCNLKCTPVPNGTNACTTGICTFTCKAQFHACAGTCVGTTDPTACGPACTACPVPPGGAATCIADTCGITCAAPSKACGGKCTAPTDPTACGAACTVCPVPPNAVATCAANACGFTCSAGFGNCDATPANGCETTFATDPLNCGACGKSCTGQPCVDGICQPPPPL